MRSVEVDGFLGRFLGHLLVVLIDLEAETLSELRFFVMLYRSILVLGAGFVKIIDFWAREGSMFDDVVAENID